MRSLYSEYGYRQFKMSKFEEYDLYSKNKNFLVSEYVLHLSHIGLVNALLCEYGVGTRRRI